MSDDLWKPARRKATTRKGVQVFKESDDEPLDLYVPPSSPTPAQKVEQRMEFARREVNDALGVDDTGLCKYGCGGTVSPKVEGVALHHHRCPYWDREGKEKTPF